MKIHIYRYTPKKFIKKKKKKKKEKKKEATASGQEGEVISTHTPGPSPHPPTVGSIPLQAGGRRECGVTYPQPLYSFFFCNYWGHIYI